MDDLGLEVELLKGFQAVRRDGNVEALVVAPTAHRGVRDVLELGGDIVKVLGSVDVESLVAVVGDLGSSQGEGQAQSSGELHDDGLKSGM